MIQEIKYNGLAAIPDDYQSPDGQLDVSLNLINEDGHLRTLFQPKTILDVDHNLNNNPQVVFIHTTSAFKHYIVKTDSNVVYWMDTLTDPTSPSATIVYDFGLARHIQNFNAIGNTLCILCDDGIHYILWKDEAYKYLGNHIPELPLSFSLEAKAVRGDTFYVNFGEVPYEYKPSSEQESIYFDNIPSQYGDNLKQRLTNAVLGKVNKFIYDNAIHQGRFVFPFFVRYAYRMYDGTLTMHSAPILMVTSTGSAPRAFIGSWHEGTAPSGEDPLYMYGVNVFLSALFHKLSYNVQESSEYISKLKEWSDIVKSVDIFISAPIYTYNQAGQVEGWRASIQEAEGYTLSRIKKNDSFADMSFWPNNYQDEDYCKWWISPHIVRVAHGELILPHLSDDNVKKNIADCGNFYFLKAINIDDIDIFDERTIIDLPEDFLNSLTSREVMTDDYDSHDILLPQRSYTYNSRLNLCGLSKTLAHPIRPSAYVCWTSNSFTKENGSSTWTDNGVSYYELYIHIRQDGREIVVYYAGFDFLGSSVDLPFLYFYYHNPNAYKLTLVAYNTRSKTDTPKVYSLPLERHSMLNGAFFFQGWNPDIPTGTRPHFSLDRTISLPNKLYTSEVNNPFFFPVTGINTIGTGTILGISSAAKALSQGQFGQFPLYAFCSDGVWALEVSDSGTFSAKQPVTRDVCSNPDSITQLDESVLFATNRGIMQLIGSDTSCISDIIATEHPFAHLTDLPNLATLATDLPAIAPFSEFLSGCRILYDYIHQRIIVYNPSFERQIVDQRVEPGPIDPDTHRPTDRTIFIYEYYRRYKYAYVFSLRSKLWGMMHTDILSSLNSYPNAIALAGIGSSRTESTTPSFQSLYLVSFDTPDTSNPVAGIAISRPVKFQAPYTLKSVYQLIQRGVFARGDVKSVLYGSRDLYSWHLVASSVDHFMRGLRGTPYKYFRIVAITSLADSQSITGATVDVEPRHVNRLH